MRTGFRSALESGLVERRETLATEGTVVRLRFAGSKMAEATLPALAPLVCDQPKAPTFTVELWDSQSAGIAPPRPPWGPHDAGPLGAVRGYNDGGLRTVVDQAARTITLCDLSSRQAVVWAESAAGLPGWWRAMPLRTLLGWLLARPGFHVVHAGAVGMGGRGVLLAGAGGVGKSTLAVMCLEAGMDYLGDDYVLLSSGPSPRAYALYGTAKLDDRSLAAVPSLAECAKREAEPVMAEGKLVLNLSILRSSRLAQAIRVEAIVVPRLESEPTSTVTPIAKSAAVRALAPSTIFQAVGGGAPALRVVGDVARSMPCYELQLGRDMSDAPKLVTSLLTAQL